VQLYEEVQTAIKPLRNLVQTTGCTLTTDGWSDTKHRPILNFLCISPNGAEFICSIDTSGTVKDGEYTVGFCGCIICNSHLSVGGLAVPCSYCSAAFMLSRFYTFTQLKCMFMVSQANLIADLITELGKDNVVCVITDSAEVNSSACMQCKMGECLMHTDTGICASTLHGCLPGAGDMIEQMFPGVSWVRCAAHGMNLLLKDICELPVSEGYPSCWKIAVHVTYVCFTSNAPYGFERSSSQLSLNWPTRRSSFSPTTMQA